MFNGDKKEKEWHKKVDLKFETFMKNVSFVACILDTLCKGLSTQKSAKYYFKK